MEEALLALKHNDAPDPDSGIASIHALQLVPADAPPRPFGEFAAEFRERFAPLIAHVAHTIRDASHHRVSGHTSATILADVTDAAGRVHPVRFEMWYDLTDGGCWCIQRITLLNTS